MKIQKTLANILLSATLASLFSVNATAGVSEKIPVAIKSFPGKALNWIKENPKKSAALGLIAGGVLARYYYAYNALVSLPITLNDHEKSIETARWMEQHQRYIGHIPLKDISMPGSHDAAAYDLEHQFAKGQGFDLLSNNASSTPVKIVAGMVKKWSQTQGLSIEDQLKSGVRFLDLRAVWRDETKDFHTTHGLYGPSLDGVLGQINGFLEAHPKEVVMIQLGDMRYMGSQHAHHDAHKDLANYFLNAFGQKIAPSSLGSDVTLNDLWSEGRQVVLFHDRHENLSFGQHQDLFWNKTDSLESRWANRNNFIDLKSDLDSIIATKDSTKFTVVQSQLTARAADIIQSIWKGGSLQNFATTVQNQLPEWLTQWSQKSPLNIVLLDFVNEDASRKIIGLNTRHKDAFETDRRMCAPSFESVFNKDMFSFF